MILLPVVWSPRVWADARESYRQGLEELEAGRFEKAAEHFRVAISERSEERVGGTFRRSYWPHLQLGVALAGLGDCRGALSAWAESDRQGQADGAVEENPELGNLRRRCTDRVQNLDAAQLAAEQALARARKAARALDEVSRVSELAPVWDLVDDGGASFAAQQASLAELLAAAETELAAADGSRELGPWQSVKARATQAAADYDALSSRARERLLELQDATATSLERLQAVEGRALAALRRVAALAPHPPELSARIEALREAAAEVNSGKALASSEELGAMRRRLVSLLNRVEEAASEPPESLWIAAESFLAGDHAAALASLEEEDYSADPRALAHACLLRAAARYALYIHGGETVELGAALEAAMEACAALESPIFPDRVFFSPRFVEYYGSSLDPPRDAAAGLDGEEVPIESPAAVDAAGSKSSASTGEESG